MPHLKFKKWHLQMPLYTWYYFLSRTVFITSEWKHKLFSQTLVPSNSFPPNLNFPNETSIASKVKFLNSSLPPISLLFTLNQTPKVPQFFQFQFHEEVISVWALGCVLPSCSSQLRAGSRSSSAFFFSFFLCLRYAFCFRNYWNFKYWNGMRK